MVLSWQRLSLFGKTPPELRILLYPASQRSVQFPVHFGLFCTNLGRNCSSLKRLTALENGKDS
ncbi:hypothetical protein DPPLL_32070 [Desulfofustis limnaeus]|uniref:Uncharacterized protein n=1 Tax=Desulfofustis limnaeus TaxID=2740163 RepID=A0ABM7WD14_9BACT|nr:hypothetical protein DPPLL_32070 [Desulfofustis limnaeus]